MIRELARMNVPRRAVQTTAAASGGFYLCLYGFGQPVAALYALFAPVALGPLSSIAGAGRQRAGVILRALPFGLLLVALGTTLAASTWTAVAGMLVVGFLLGFSPIAGPRSAGAAPGLQLFYILACFPPYAPQTLPARLFGAGLGVLLLAACSAVLLPGVPERTYRACLADALEAATAAARGRGSVESIRERGDRLRLSKVAPGERPTGPGRKDRALAQAGSATRRLLEGLAELSVPAWRGGASKPDAACDVLLSRIADTCASAAGALRAGTSVPSAAPLEAATEGIQDQRIHRAAPQQPDLTVLRKQSAVLELAAAAWVAVTALGIAERGRSAPSAWGDLFYYANLPAHRLWARRVAGNLTRRSVWFQNAARVALGLAAARLVAGSLDLAHGFWVLLAVLTLGRTTVGATWGAIRRALVGTLSGAAAAGTLLLLLGPHTDVYAALLVPTMLVAFTLGPSLGIAYAQGLFTFLVAVVFAQVASVNWRLSEVRLLDVVTGSVIGLLCGLLAWPAGGHREVRRAMAELLHACGTLVPPTVGLLTSPRPSRSSLPTVPVLRRLRLAEAAYAQYRNEPPVDEDGTSTDWHAVLIVAHQTLQGTHRLLRFDLPAAGVRGHEEGHAAVRRERGAAPDGVRPVPTEPGYGIPLPVLVDLDVWLTSIGRRLDRIAASIPTRPV
ncbi:FUSC family protein [Streptomyces sp. MUM 203J]|uniref:FUSC family protein n=1 Tax=Streptomyces sp. MUM 203J TaxID=2791990 RepID=UPI001F041DF6|nr:FUSC family protein [Streptomyces sp. MUM 203J]MCH0540346.1 FUSC family protein [Streptomyces sp. MUM 203J]